MSCHWDIKCTGCDATAGFWWNDGSRQLAALLARRSDLAVLARALRLVREAVDVDVEVRVGYGDGSPDLDFFVAHEDHALVVWSEYGYSLGGGLPPTGGG